MSGPLSRVDGPRGLRMAREARPANGGGPHPRETVTWAGPRRPNRALVEDLGERDREPGEEHGGSHVAEASAHDAVEPRDQRVPLDLRQVSVPELSQGFEEHVRDRDRVGVLAPYELAPPATEPDE